MNDSSIESGRAGGIARAALSLAALWILAGALFKLLAGSPSDLPPIVRETLSIDLGLKYRLAIGIELAIVATALLRPSIGWFFVLAQLCVFDLVLALSLSEASCGCFGSSITIPPAWMMVIDSTFLIAVLATRPWRGFKGRRTPLSLVATGVLLGLALPWIHDRQIHFDGAPHLATGNGTDSSDPTDAGGQPDKAGWVEFNLSAWEGQLVHDTPLARFVDPNSLPDTGLYVLWRWDCDHCAKHLAALAESETGDRMIALLRLESPNDNEGNRAVYAKPSGPFVFERNLPPTVEYVVTTPGELTVEGYTILKGEEGVTD